MLMLTIDILHAWLWVWIVTSFAPGWGEMPRALQLIGCAAIGLATPLVRWRLTDYLRSRRV